jgi:hypothetical protein
MREEGRKEGKEGEMEEGMQGEIYRDLNGGFLCDVIDDERSQKVS